MPGMSGLIHLPVMYSSSHYISIITDKREFFFSLSAVTDLSDSYTTEISALNRECCVIKKLSTYYHSGKNNVG